MTQRAWINPGRTGQVVAAWLLALWLSALGLSALFGCASSPDAPDSGDRITDSDESGVRKRARIRLELALGYLEQDKTTIALDEIKQAIIADPNFADAYSLRGLIYMRLHDFGIAEASFHKALSISPDDPNVMHNLGWLKCQQALYPEAFQLFSQAIAMPLYGERAKTWMAQGLCQVRAGLRADAEQSLLKAYEYDAANPVTGYNLAHVLFQNADYLRARFYIRRLNNSEFANAESLWLGIKIEHKLTNNEALLQLANQLEKRFSQSREATALHQGAFDE